MTTSAPVQPVNSLRLFRVILYFNIPLIALFVTFNAWRAYVHGSGASACADFICAMTERYGDVLPVVASFTEEAAKRGAKVNVTLARELLFFNVIFCIAYTPIATALFCFAIARLRLTGAVKYGKAALAMPFGIGFVAFMLFFTGWSRHWPAPYERRGWTSIAIFDHWAGAFTYNGRSLIFSTFTMLMAFGIFNLVAYAKREFGTPEKDRR